MSAAQATVWEALTEDFEVGQAATVELGDQGVGLQLASVGPVCRGLDALAQLVAGHVLHAARLGWPASA